MKQGNAGAEGMGVKRGSKRGKRGDAEVGEACHPDCSGRVVHPEAETVADVTQDVDLCARSARGPAALWPPRGLGGFQESGQWSTRLATSVRQGAHDQKELVPTEFRLQVPLVLLGIWRRADSQ